MKQRPDRRISIMAGSVAAAVALVVGRASAVLANHVFPDSTDGQALHTQVGNVAGAGCATGFPNGTFDPQGNVNRQQFAAWMNRCAGRVARLNGSNATLATSGSAAKQTIGTITIQAGATGDIATGGFVVISGNIRAETTNPANCPCFVQAEVAEEFGAPGAADDVEFGGAAVHRHPPGCHRGERQELHDAALRRGHDHRVR